MKSRLTFLNETKKSKYGVIGLYKCSCGNECWKSVYDVNTGHCKSCGCLHKERFTNKTHSQTKTTLYKKWIRMKARCYNPNTKDYISYGGRGITICDEWLNDFMSFKIWCDSNGYKQILKLDRIDNDKGYSPDNCRFITHKENCQNKRNNRFITFNGETKTLSQWADEIDISQGTLKDRLNKLGWSVERALTEKLNNKK